MKTIKSIHGDGGSTRYWELLILDLRTVLLLLSRSWLVNSALEVFLVLPASRHYMDPASA